ncbi:MAG: BRCT domain-containing protein [Spirochaetes bacterium]|nr:BRCT domain-containing protein [Spirochaetota bacterium]
MKNFSISDEYKTIHELEGLLKGISSDSVIADEEIKMLEKWINNHQNLKEICPFSDLYEIIRKSHDEKYLEQDVKDELLQFCNEFDSATGVLDRLSREISVLKGFITGIMADDIIEVEELVRLEQWIIARQDLAGKWPFRELSELITAVLEDNRITEEEHEEMVTLFNSILRDSGSQTGIESDDTLNAEPFGSVDLLFSPGQIEISGKTFCLAGEFAVKSRSEYISLAKAAGASVESAITSGTDFLVIGGKSNYNWAFSTYGGKVEKVLKLNEDEKAGIRIISEDMFAASLNMK